MKKILSAILIVIMCLTYGVGVLAEDSYSITITDAVEVKVNGEVLSENAQVGKNDVVSFVADEDIVAVGIDGKYYPVNKGFKLTEDIDLSDATLYKLGLKMVEGAQVRVGKGELSEEGKTNATTDSGLRFVALADYADTVISDTAVEFGIKVVAEGNDNPVYIKAEKFQNEDNSIFTAAITNLAESNYNRKYTACAYAVVPMADGTEKEFLTSCVTRSIYQVSVGILKNSSAEAESDMPYTIDDAVKNVLSAYVNQTGIRLTYSKDGVMSARVNGKGAYTGELFFTVSSSLNENGGTDVVITPLDEEDGFGNPVAIPLWWQDYVRVNNNNSVATKYISNVKLENGALSFTFTLPDNVGYTFNQEDNVTIVSEVTPSYIKGFKAGEEVTYSRAEVITVLGLATTMDDVVPGSVIMVGTNSDGEVAAVELLASLGLPINPEGFEADFGVYAPSDGSTKYQNIITEMYSKSGSKITCQNLPDTTKIAYKFASTSSICYRVGIAMSGDTPVITATGNTISTYPSIFENTAKYHNYLYLRYDSEAERVKECVYYCVPKDLDFTGDGEYSDIFSLDNYRVIIK